MTEPTASSKASAQLAQVFGTHKPIRLHCHAETIPGPVVYRYDAPLFFANAQDFRRRALAAARCNGAARWFVLNVEANVEVDFTALEAVDRPGLAVPGPADRGRRLPAVGRRAPAAPGRGTGRDSWRCLNTAATSRSSRHNVGTAGVIASDGEGSGPS